MRPELEPTQYILWGVWGFLPIAIIVVGWFFFKNDTHFPISSRSTMITSVLCLALLAGTASTIAFRLTSMSCTAHLAILLVVDNIMVTTYFLRAMYVLFQLRIIEVINHITEWTATEETKAAGKNDWYMKNARRCLSHRSYAYFFLADITLCGIIIAISVGVHASLRGNRAVSSQCDLSEESSHPLNVARIMTIALKAIFCALLSTRLLKYGEDAGLVKTELKTTMILAPPCILAHFVTQGVLMTDNSNQTGADISWSLYMGCELFVFIMAIARPLYLTRYLSEHTEAAYYQGRQPDISNLADIINSKAGYNAFVQFLKSEFSEENILFWHEVQTFVNKCQALKSSQTANSVDMNKMLAAKIANREIAAELGKTAVQIFETYCRRGAPAQINISDTVLQELSTQLSNMNADRAETVLDKISNLFDSVKSQVFELMDKDSFARFRQSPLYNHLRTRMVRSGWIDTSGGETLDSFDLPPKLISVRDADEERQKTLARRRQLAIVDPEAVRQQKMDQRASQMLTQTAKVNRKFLIDLSEENRLKSPVDTEDVVYPYQADPRIVPVAETEMGTLHLPMPGAPPMEERISGLTPRRTAVAMLPTR